jgi:hypothetical protein
VSQISPPIRILLVVAVAFIGVYMLFMRPKEEVLPPAEPVPNTQSSEPAVSEPGKVAEAAQGAVEAANGQLEQQQSVDGVDGEAAATGTKSQSTPAAKNSEAATTVNGVDLKGLPKPIAKAFRKEKVVVLLFWNGKSADDKAVHKALAKVDRWDGRVYVGSASIKKISKYGQIARGVDVEQSPTVIVADPELRAETLVGYVDAPTIDQAVVDAFRNSTGIYTSEYLAAIDRVCTKAGSQLYAIPDPDNLGQVTPFMTRARDRWHRFEAQFKAVPAPKKYRTLKRETVADNAAATAILNGWIAYLGPKPTAARLVNSLDSYGKRYTKLGKQYNERMDNAHVLGCGTNG